VSNAKGWIKDRIKCNGGQKPGGKATAGAGREKRGDEDRGVDPRLNTTKQKDRVERNSRLMDSGMMNLQQELIRQNYVVFLIHNRKKT